MAAAPATAVMPMAKLESNPMQPTASSPARVGSPPEARPLAKRLERLERIRPLLCCPLCHGDLGWSALDARCQGCETTYPVEEGVPILVPPALREQGLGKPLPRDQHASMHPYSPASQAIIDEHAGGWVLDLGAGGKGTERPHVVQIDVFRFPMVDVVGSADALPFKANVFDAVVSQAVFEHLQYPEAAASEIWRVLKPAGVAKIDTAFLQPEHAYPHHYFNATEAGLRHWFRDFELQWSGVEPYQHPKWALAWFVSVLFAGQHDHDRQVLEGYTLRGCVDALSRISRGKATPADLELNRAFDGLVPEVIRSLAAGVSVKAIKRDAAFGIRRASASQAGSALLLETERRLAAAQQRLRDAHDHAQKLAEIEQVIADRTRFLAHEYALRRVDPIVNPGFWRPLSLLVQREIHVLKDRISEALRSHVSEAQWLRLKGFYRRLTGGFETQPVDARRTGAGLMAPPPAGLLLWHEPRDSVELLDLFFSLHHQSLADWRLMLYTSSSPSSELTRLLWELSQRDARVTVASQPFGQWDWSDRLVWCVPNGAILAFEAVREVVTAAAAHPHVRWVTGDIERWYSLHEHPLACFASAPTDADASPEVMLSLGEWAQRHGGGRLGLAPAADFGAGRVCVRIARPLLRLLPALICARGTVASVDSSHLSET